MNSTVADASIIAVFSTDFVDATGYQFVRGVVILARRHCVFLCTHSLQVGVLLSLPAM